MPRGKTAKSLALIDACAEILAEIQPASVRAVCYQLFIRQAIPSMEVRHTKRVSAQLVDAREAGLIPWEWIVDETRDAERQLRGWEDPEAFMRSVGWWYKRDRWAMQPCDVEVWSEKGTVRGTLASVLRDYGVTFRPMHGFNSATEAHNVAQETQRNPKPLHAFYVGDWDCSGMYMSEVDLPARLERYGGALTFTRLALSVEDTQAGGLPGFPARDKQTDSRYDPCSRGGATGSRFLIGSAGGFSYETGTSYDEASLWRKDEEEHHGAPGVIGGKFTVSIPVSLL